MNAVVPPTGFSKLVPSQEGMILGAGEGVETGGGRGVAHAIGWSNSQDARHYSIPNRASPRVAGPECSGTLAVKHGNAAFPFAS